MNRPLTAVAAVLLVSAPAFAATIGPDAFGYTASDQAISWVNISGTGTAVLDGVDDATVGPIGLGFTFSFYGANFTTVFISSNGLLSFGSANSQFSNVNIATTSPGVNVPTLAVYWDDIVTFGVDDRIYYQTLGAPGSRTFVVQWNQVSHINDSLSGNTYTFEAILSEGSNQILFQYLDTVVGGGPFSNGESATIGIRNTGGQGNGQNLQWGFNTAGSVTSGTAILFGTAVAPEPGTWALFGAGALGLAALRRRRAARARR